MVHARYKYDEINEISPPGVSLRTGDQMRLVVIMEKVKEFLQMFELEEILPQFEGKKAKIKIINLYSLLV